MFDKRYQVHRTLFTVKIFPNCVVRRRRINLRWFQSELLTQARFFVPPMWVY